MKESSSSDGNFSPAHYLPEEFEELFPNFKSKTEANN
jgi:hypothetical protein